MKLQKGSEEENLEINIGETNSNLIKRLIEIIKTLSYKLNY